MLSITDFSATYRNRNKSSISFLTVIIPFTYEKISVPDIYLPDIPLPNYEFKSRDSFKSFTWDDINPVSYDEEEMSYEEKMAYEDMQEMQSYEEEMSYEEM